MTQDDNVVKLLDFGEALQLADMGKNPALLRVVLESFPAPVSTQTVYDRWERVMAALRENNNV